MAVNESAVIASACVLVLLVLSMPAGLHAKKYNVKFGQHNIAMGQRRFYPSYPLDALLFHDSPKIKGSWFPWPKVQSRDVCYPAKDKHLPRITITSFKVTDLGQGGFAFVKEGGVGWNKVCLHLKTQRGKGYHFNVDIWGYNN